MAWLEAAAAIEALEDVAFDEGLVRAMEQARAGAMRGPIRFSAPTFKAYDSAEFAGCGKAAFPAFSVTGPACALQCDHCRGALLKTMAPALTPDDLDRQVRRLASAGRLSGFLLSGGSDRRNEIRYERFYPVIERLKRDLPHLRIAIHSALIDRPRARAMAAAGVDSVMMDVIGADDTIREVYHVNRPVADFEETLAALVETGMEVAPHVVIGLHYGRILGEANAIDIVARHRTQSLVFVVIMPQYADAGRFVVPEAHAIGAIFHEARLRLPERDVLLGCARPSGQHKRLVDAYAVMAGLDGVAFPADGASEVAALVGRPVERQRACCSVREAAGQEGSVAPCAA